MGRVMWCVVLVSLVVNSVFGAPGDRHRRGYNGYGDSSSGYGRGSDERDASVSEESGCNNNKGYGGGGGGGRNYGYNRGSGSREYAYNRDGRGSDSRGGRSFTRSSASAVASAFGLQQRANV